MLDHPGSSSSNVGGSLVYLAVPGRIVELVDEPDGLAHMDTAGVKRNVDVGLFE